MLVTLCLYVVNFLQCADGQARPCNFNITLYIFINCAVCSSQLHLDTLKYIHLYSERNYEFFFKIHISC